MDSLPEQTSFFWLHAAWFSASILVALLLYFRPKPQVGLAALLLMHGLAFLGYYGNLPRTYAVGVSSDRALGVGMAMAVADGGSPFNHVQVEFGNLEPMWTFTVAALSGFVRDRVPYVYDHMTLIVLTLTGLGFYSAWCRRGKDEDETEARWRGAFVAAAVVGLSSTAMMPDPPIHHFWQANFVFKPNHALAFGLVGLMSRGALTRWSWMQLGVLQAALIWAFILDWAYAIPGLFLAAVLSENRREAVKKATLSTGLGLALAAPYIAHLMRDYSPVGKGREEMPAIWLDQMGQRLISPALWLLDPGPVVVLFAIGVYFALKRGERDSFAFLITGPFVATCYLIGLRVGVAPEPDEGFYYSRMVFGAGAGLGLWELARRWSPSRAGRYATVFGLILATSYPAYFNPWNDDRYYEYSVVPLDPQIAETAAWIRANTTRDSVLVSLEGIMLSGLTGRRFLMVRPEQTADRAAREQAEADIITSMDEGTVRRAVERYGVTHVIVDDRLRERYGDAARGLGNRPWFTPEFANAFARILVVKPKV